MREPNTYGRKKTPQAEPAGLILPKEGGGDNGSVSRRVDRISVNTSAVRAEQPKSFTPGDRPFEPAAKLHAMARNR
jgi:hypothetical protein